MDLTIKNPCQEIAHKKANACADRLRTDPQFALESGTPRGQHELAGWAIMDATLAEGGTFVTMFRSQAQGLGRYVHVFRIESVPGKPATARWLRSK